MSSHQVHGAGAGQRRHPRWEPRSGTEPRTARSDLPLRRLLGWIFAPLFLLGAAACGVFAASAGGGPDGYRTPLIAFGALLAVLFVVSVVDLVVVHRRMAYERSLRADPRA